MTILATDQATEEVALAADRKPIEFGDYSTGERNSDGQTVRFGSKAAVDAKWDRRPVCPDSQHDARLIDLRLRAMCGRLLVGKENLHFAALVGAAMCSAC